MVRCRSAEKHPRRRHVAARPGWRILPLVLGCAWSFATALGAAESNPVPRWWLARGAIACDAESTNDYAVALLGHVYWMASNAVTELDAHLPGGGGDRLHDALSCIRGRDAYAPCNAGQLKHLAKPFYDRLAAEGYAAPLPWTATTEDDCDYAAVNIGQLKHAFAFRVVGSVAGTVTGAGYQVGAIRVLAVHSPGSWQTEHSVGPAPDGEFLLCALPGVTNYWIKAFHDGNANGRRDTGEATGTYAANPLANPMDWRGVAFALESRDADGDALPDDWEIAHFGDLAQSGGGDSDGDGLTDEEEYGRDLNPMLADSDRDGLGDAHDANPGRMVDGDGDGLPDDWEAALIGHLGLAGGDDPDADGHDNESEWRRGTHPLLTDRETPGPAMGLCIHSPAERGRLP